MVAEHCASIQRLKIAQIRFLVIPMQDEVCSKLGCVGELSGEWS